MHKKHKLYDTMDHILVFSKNRAMTEFGIQITSLLWVWHVTLYDTEGRCHFPAWPHNVIT